MKSFSKIIKVEKSHLDEILHVNNVQYLYWVQEIAREHYTHLANAKHLENYVWVALNHFIEYKTQAFLDDNLLVTTYVEEFGPTTSKRVVTITNNENKVLVCKTVTTWCLLNAKTHKPVRVPQEIRNLFDD
jgi:acyl-CoA thioester hydrolase